MSHNCSQSHSGHAHDHSHAPQNATHVAFKIGTLLNLGFCILEMMIGLLANSMALVADAAHNFMDVLGLAMAWLSLVLSDKIPFGRFTYGLKRLTIISAFLNGLILLGSCVWIAWESIQRFQHSQPTSGWIMMVVASIAIFVNGFSAWLFAKNSKTDINTRGAFLHLLTDAAISLGVVISGAAMQISGKTWIDPVVSLLIVGIILKGTWSLFVESIMQILDATPQHIDLDAVRRYLTSLPEVVAEHDLHVWNLGTHFTALSVHLVVKKDDAALLKKIREDLKNRFGIDHPTIQIEHDKASFTCDSHC